MIKDGLIKIIKSETSKAIATGAAIVILPLAGWSALTFTHNTQYGTPSEMCEIANKSVVSEIIDESKKSDNPMKYATFVPAYGYALATDVGNKAYRKLYCE